MEVTMLNSDIRQEARNLMQGLWGSCVPIILVYMLMIIVPGFILQKITPILNYAYTMIIGGPLSVALAKIFLRIYNKEQVEIGQLFEGFNDFTRTFTAYLLVSLFVLLWTLLLIVPGIIASLGYSQTFFILAEDPNISATEAMKKSKEMMMGHKGEYFMLGLSFIGWAILCIFTLGIGFLWLESYTKTSYAIFYKNLTGKMESTVTHSDTFVPHNVDSLRPIKRHEPTAETTETVDEVKEETAKTVDPVEDEIVN
jgi:uncharacterized membrane protein